MPEGLRQCVQGWNTWGILPSLHRKTDKAVEGSLVVAYIIQDGEPKSCGIHADGKNAHLTQCIASPELKEMPQNKGKMHTTQYTRSAIKEIYPTPL